MMLDVDGLTYGYRRRVIGSNVSFAVAPGETVCLLGPNGSGKSTLFKTILGVLPMHAGRITLEGRDILEMSAMDRARAIAYVPQALTSSFAFTVRELVLMGRAPHLSAFATPSKVDVAKANESLRRVGIVALADRVANELSGGERQLVLIARAIAQECRLMIMDEPTASLDLGNRLRILAQVLQLARAGVATMLSTHAPDDALAIATRAIVLREGQIIANGVPAEVITTERLSELYGVDVDIVQHGERRVTVPRL
ncbi:MAG: ABC transporter ATP-binding protein [Clostridia bacterium]|nr:ABC transporter ATP-binding protein [Deltaproteobacteria bacterium]